MCEAGLADTTRATVSRHFESAHPAENFASLEDIPEARGRGGPFGSKEGEEEKKEDERGSGRAADLNHNKGKKDISRKRICILVNESSTEEEEDDEDKLEASSAKRPRVELSATKSDSVARAGEMLPDHRRYAGALIPLPYIEFPLAAKFYSCTVCPADSTFTALSQVEKHRESDQHRSQYGEKFRDRVEHSHWSISIQILCSLWLNLTMLTPSSMP